MLEILSDLVSVLNHLVMARQTQGYLSYSQIPYSKGILNRGLMFVRLNPSAHLFCLQEFTIVPTGCYWYIIRVTITVTVQLYVNVGALRRQVFEHRQ